MHGRDHVPFAADHTRLGLFQIKVFSDTTLLVTGDGAYVMGVPDDLDGAALKSVAAFVTVVSSSGTPTIQIRNITGAVDMLSTSLTIDASEFNSYTAATPAVIDTSTNLVAAGDAVAVDIDGAGTDTMGLSVNLGFW